MQDKIATLAIHADTIAPFQKLNPIGIQKAFLSIQRSNPRTNQ